MQDNEFDDDYELELDLSSEEKVNWLGTQNDLDFYLGI